MLTPHEEPSCFTVHSILRNLPALPEFLVEWKYPRMLAAPELDPGQIRSRSGQQKLLTDREFREAFITKQPQSTRTIAETARKQKDLSRRTVERYLSRLLAVGAVRSSAGTYWTPE